MRVTVNGQDTDVTANDLAGLLNEMEYEFTQLAIAVNYQVVPRGRWARNHAQCRRPDRNHHPAARWLRW